MTIHHTRRYELAPWPLFSP